jgi:hypothetical protein
MPLGVELFCVVFEFLIGGIVCGETLGHGFVEAACDVLEILFVEPRIFGVACLGQQHAAL